MRRTFILNRALPLQEKPKKRWQLNGKDTTKVEIISLMKEKGYNITERSFIGNIIAKDYKGIPIGNSHWGLIVWAKKSEDTQPLMQLLQEDGYFDHACYLPVEQRADNAK